jgi:hypothetical protein
MAREWFAVHASMLGKARYKRLSAAGRGGLMHTLILAAYQAPEATWPDPDDLRHSLAADGFPEGVYQELVDLGWLVIDDGAVIVGDWDRDQYATSAAIRRDWEASRKREWRLNKKKNDAPPNGSLHPPLPTETVTGNSDSYSVPDMSRTKTPEELLAKYANDFHGGEWKVFLLEWFARGFRLPPSGSMDDDKSQRAIVYEIVRDFPTIAPRWCATAPPGASPFEVVKHLKESRQTYQGAAV